MQHFVEGIRTVYHGWITHACKRKKWWTLTYIGGEMQDVHEEWIAREDEGFEVEEEEACGGADEVQ